MKQSHSSYFHPSKTGTNFRPNIFTADSTILGDAGKTTGGVQLHTYFRKQGKKNDQDDLTQEDRKKAKSIAYQVLKRKEQIAERKMMPLKPGMGHVRMLEQRSVNSWLRQTARNTEYEDAAIDSKDLGMF